MTNHQADTNNKTSVPTSFSACLVSCWPSFIFSFILFRFLNSWQLCGSTKTNYFLDNYVAVQTPIVFIAIICSTKANYYLSNYVAVQRPAFFSAIMWQY